jgi:exopolysaccharide biosynthesis polyprenyl glycosylphosphotransferase
MKRSIFGIYHPAHKLVLLLSDLVMLALTFYVATKYRLDETPDYLSIEYIGLSVILIFSLFIGGAYTSTGIANRPKLPLSTFFIVLAAALPSLLFIYLLGPERFTALLGRGVFPFAIIGFGLTSMFSRLIVNRIFHDPAATRKVLLLGSIDTNGRIYQALSTSHLQLNVSHSRMLDPKLAGSNSYSAIVVCPDHKPDEIEQQTLINHRLAGIPIFSLSDFFESFLFLVPVQEIDNHWFIRAQGFTMLHSSVATRVKRGVDIVAAIFLLIVTMPIMAVTALVIKLSSRGPVLFSQTRVGFRGKPFTLYKFRTMRNNAEKQGAQWATNNDPRVLPIGHFLRKSRIDELPQCWNILKGDMSIIGPRPERPEFTSKLTNDIPYYDLRHIIKPGLTGWAQVNYPYGASTEDALRKLQYDLYYIKNYSLFLDLNITLRTLITVFQRGGR